MMARMSIDGASRVGEPAVLSQSLAISYISHRIVSDIGDLYLPPHGRPLFLSIELIVRETIVIKRHVNEPH